MKSHPLLKGASIVMFCSCSLMSYAANITIVSGQLETQTVASSEDGDVIRVDAGGTIDSVANAVDVANDDVVVTNNGRINSSGIAVAVDGNAVSISNNGRILSDLVAVEVAGDNASVSNSGTVRSADEAVDIVGNNSRIENTGTIFSDSSDAITIDGDNARISNKGTINALFGDAIVVTGNDARIVNDGRVIASDGDGIVVSGDNAAVTNNGQLIIDGLGIEVEGNNALIENHGEIFNNDSDNSISILGKNSRIVNTGDIIGDGLAIFTEGDNINIENRGELLSVGDDAAEIDGDSVRFVNSGRIFAEFEAITAVGNNFLFHNSGMVESIDGNGLLIEGDDASILNSGYIRGKDASIEISGDSAVVTNTGRVVSDQDFAVVIDGDNAHIANSGQLSGEGGVNLQGNGLVLTNNGVIEAVNDNAVQGDAGQQTVNLGAGSQILGQIDLGGGEDTLNINSVAPSAQISFANIENVQFGEDAVGVVAGDTVTLFDATGELTRSTNSAEINTAVHNAVLKQTRGSSQSGQRVWGEVLSGDRERDADGNIQGYEQSYVGFSSGYDVSIGALRIGVLAAAVQSDSSTEVQSLSTETDSLMAGVYGYFGVSALNVGLSVFVGSENHDNTRLVIDSQLGGQDALAEIDGQFVSISGSIDTDLSLSRRWTLRPSASISFTSVDYDAYTESGTTNSNISFDDRSSDVLMARAGLSTEYNLNQRAQFELRAGALARQVDDEAISASINGARFSFESTADDSVAGGFLGAGVNAKLSHRVDITADAEYQLLQGDEDGFGIRAGLNYRF